MNLDEALGRFRRAGKREEWFQCIQAIYAEDKAKGSEYIPEFRREMKKAVSEDPEKIMNLLKRSYLLRAKDSFDEYMIYLEWSREPEKRFWLPRRKVLLPVCKAMQALEDDELDLLAVSLPPGTGKSTLKQYLLSWQMGKFPDKPNLDSGFSGAMTKSTYNGVLQILTDPEYLWAEVFPGMQIITDAKELRIDVDKRHKFSTLTCRSIDGSLTGATRCEGFLTADDLVSGIEEALSKERLDTKWAKYASDLKSRKKMGAKEVHIATRWSVHDVIGRLERENENNPRAKFIVIPALNEKGESNFDYDFDKGFDTKYFLEMKRANDSATFNALFMNQPIDREGLLYDIQDLRRYYSLPKDEKDKIIPADAVLAVVDTAEGGGDDTVMPVFAVYGDDHYLIDIVCSNAAPVLTDNLLAKTLVRNKVNQAEFESNSAGGRTADKVDELTRKMGGFTHITKRRTTQHKETKIMVEATWVQEHVLFPDPSTFERGSVMDQAINKLCTYTMMGKNKHDDVPDAFAMYAQFFRRNILREVKVLDRRRFGI